ncbi:SGNH/GDSL hydrolase family protein [Actinocatenispora rupis]|uniref:Lipase n=1 Tax=Actinocatenispora rupis TaxID=519421 RepID=A0A8J3IXY5_9ACTN|nr:lipase [Actinocatenispora rupis]
MLTAGSRVLFTGDSITDAARDRANERHLGGGYAMIAAALHRARHPERGVTFGNRGISGRRVRDLRAAWDEETVAPRPDVVSVLIGVNDTMRRYRRGEPTTVEEFERDYRDIVGRAAEFAGTVVLVEPFLTPVSEEQRAWRDDLDPKIAVVHKVAADHATLLVRADTLFTARAATTGPEYWCPDGVHPTPAGHALLAEEWLRVVEYDG